MIKDKTKTVEKLEAMVEKQQDGKCYYSIIVLLAACKNEQEITRIVSALQMAGYIFSSIFLV